MKYSIYLIIFLGILSAFGPFITDMYLPILPSMAEIFHTVPVKVQLGLTTSLLGLAVGQVFLGPLSDKFGRKIIVVCSLAIFSGATIACMFSPTIDFFNICRFLQGLGGAGGIVMSRSIATDCYTGKQLAGTLAIIGAINGIMPVIAPVAGGFVAQSLGWQWIFGVLFVIGVVLLLMTLPLKESFTDDLRHKGKIISLFNSYPELFRNRKYIYCVLVFAFTYGVLFSYISSSSFIVEDHYRLSEFAFSLTFGLNAIAMAAGSAFVLKLKDISKAVVISNLSIVFIALMQIVFYFVFDNFFTYEGLTFILAFLLGVIFTAASAMAMDAGRSHTGTASAILGTCGYLFGGAISPLAGLGNIILSSTIIIFLCSLFASLFAYLISCYKNLLNSNK